MRIDSGIDVKLHKVCSCLFIGLFSYVFIKSQKLQCFLGVMMDYVLYCIFCIILYYIALYCIILYYYVGFYGLLMTSYAIPLQDAARLDSVICANRSEQGNAASLDAEPGDLAVIPCEDTTAKLSNLSNPRGRPKKQDDICTLRMWLDSERPGMYRKLPHLEHVYECVKCGRQVNTYFGSACARKWLAQFQT